MLRKSSATVTSRNSSRHLEDQPAAPPHRPPSPLAAFSVTATSSANNMALQPEQVDTVLFHANCPDGRAAAFVAYVRLAENARYIPVKHGDPVPSGMEGRAVALLDFSFPQKEMSKLLKQTSGKLVVLDHHKTAKDVLMKMSAANRVFDMDHSGCVLAWNFFSPLLPVPKILQYIEDRDLWRWKLPDSKAFSRGWRCECDPHVWRNDPLVDFEPFITLQLAGDPGIKRVIAKGNAVIHHEKTLIRKHVAEARPRRLISRPDWRCRVVNATVLQSEIGAALCQQVSTHATTSAMTSSGQEVGTIDKDAGCDVAIIWRYAHTLCYPASPNEDDRCYVVSLRSASNNFDVGTLAAEYGGGGHTQAAGFSLTLADVGILGIEYLFEGKGV